jgi:hypothetical protein
MWEFYAGTKLPCGCSPRILRRDLFVRALRGDVGSERARLDHDDAHALVGSVIPAA